MNHIKVREEIGEIFKNLDGKVGTSEEDYDNMIKMLFKKINYYHSCDSKYQVSLPAPPMIIVQQLLPTIDMVGKMLFDIRRLYHDSMGNQPLFFRKVKEMNQLYPVLIHILVGIPYPIEKVITFSYWDRFVAKIIISWCTLCGNQIHIMGLFNLIDTINGDCPSKFVR
jgi:hypothetical protein